MFKDIDEKLKSMALIIVFLGITIGGIWLIYLLYKYNNLDSYYEDNNIYLIPMIYSITLMFGSVVLSYFIFAFGQIITHLKRIDYKLNGVPKAEIEEKVPDEEIIKELEQDSSYKN